MAVRAKMVLSSIVKSKYTVGGDEQVTLKFNTQYDNTLPEDQRFCKATPSVSAEFLVTNPDALSQFELGKAYYFDFVEA